MGWSMFGEDYEDDDSNDGWGSPIRDTSSIRSDIAKIKSKGHSATLSEIKELKRLEEILYEMQAECSHFWTIVLLFNKHMRFCKWCDKEDCNYKHPL